MATAFNHERFRITQFSGGYDRNFTYLIVSDGQRRSLLVDASVPVNLIRSFTEHIPEALLITHSHGDHIAWLEDYLATFPGIKIIAGTNTLLPAKLNVVKVRDRELWCAGDLKINLIYTPGHYPDSVCFQIDDALFTGDTIFIGRTGRTIDPESNIEDLYHSVYSRILTLDENTLVYPGHDYGQHPRITLKDNIALSPLLRAENMKDFIGRMADFERDR